MSKLYEAINKVEEFTLDDIVKKIADKLKVDGITELPIHEAYKMISDISNSISQENKNHVVSQLENTFKIKIAEPTYKNKKYKLDKYKTLTIYYSGEELPGIKGDSSKKVNGYDNRYDLSSEELWTTGWYASVQNGSERPFKSFDNINLHCSDNEKNMEYELPELPEDFKKDYLKAVNDYQGYLVV